MNLCDLPDPGSEAARGEGCICDPGQEPPEFTVEKMCPVHGLAVMKALIDDGGAEVTEGEL